MAEQLQKTFQGVQVEEEIPQFDSQQYMSTMQQVMQNPQFMNMAERLGSAMIYTPQLMRYNTASVILRQLVNQFWGRK